MEILVFSRVRLREPGVHALCTFHTAAALAARGARVTLFADRQGASDAEIHEVMGAESSGRLAIRQAAWQYRSEAVSWAARGWIRREREGSPRFGFFNEVRRYVPILIDRARAVGHGVVVEVHNAAGLMALEDQRGAEAGRGCEDPRVAARASLERRILSASDVVVAPQALTLRAIEPLVPPASLRAVIPNGTLLPPERRDVVRDIDVLYVGSLQDWKGIETLVAAIARLPGRHLTIVGGRRGDRREALRRLARDLGCDSRVHLVPQVPPAEVWRWYARARVGVVPLHGDFLEAREYTCPVKLVEMMAAGLPIVAARLPSVQSLVREGDEALMAEWDDPAEFAGAIRRVLEDRVLAWRLSSRVRAKAASFSHDARAERLLSLMWASVERAQPARGVCRASRGDLAGGNERFVTSTPRPPLSRADPADGAGAAANPTILARPRRSEIRERSMRRLRRGLGRAGVLAASLVAALAGAELSLRAFAPQRLDSVLRWPDGTLRHHPSLSLAAAGDAAAGNVSFNSLGLRGAEVASRKPSGVTRVLFLGDALVEGREVGEKDVVTAALTNLAGRKGRVVEVINAGVAGAGTADEMLLWERLGRSLDPDVVVLGFHPNDVRNNCERGGGDPEGPRSGPAGPGESGIRWLYEARRFVAARSHVYALARSALRASRTVVEGHRAARPEAAAGCARDSALTTVDLLDRGPSPEVTHAWETTESLLTGLKKSVEETGARFVLAHLPMRLQVDEEYWRAHTERGGLDPARYDVALPARRLRGWAEVTETRFVDLLPSMRAAGADAALYEGVETAWSAAAHRVAAERLKTVLF